MEVFFKIRNLREAIYDEDNPCSGGGSVRRLEKLAINEKLFVMIV